MDQLIEALQIFLKYGNVAYPTHCEHDVMFINPHYSRDDMSEEDVERLDQLGFFWDEDIDGFKSYRYGSG